MIVRFISGFVGLVLAHPGRAALLGLFVMLTGAGLATRIRLADDARALVAEGDPEVQVQLEALSHFTAVDQLLLHVDGQGHDDELEPAAVALTDSLLASGVFADARFETRPSEQLDLVTALLPRRFLLDPREPRELFSDAALRTTLAELKDQLLAPQALVTKSFLLRDPLGSIPAGLARLRTTPGLPKLDTSSGRFVSRDGHSLLVIATPHGNPFSGDDAGRTMAAVEEARHTVAKVAPHVIVRPLGAHRYGHDAQTLIKSDVHFSVLSSLLGVLAVFVAFFRRPRLLLAAIPPLGFGACFAAGIVGLIGVPVHGIVLAFAGACLGLSIDYTIHLISSAAAAARDTRQALALAAERMGPSISLVMTTTIAALLALLFAHVPALVQMGLIASAAVLGAFLGTLLWVPIVLPFIAKTTPVPPLLQGPWTRAVDFAERRPLLVIASALVLLLGFGGLALDTRIDGDLRNLDTHTVEAQADEAAFAAAFGDVTTTGLLLIDGTDLDAALTTAARADQELRAAGIEHTLSLATVAPPRAVAASRRAAWCEAPDALLARLDSAAQASGFRPNAFVDFAQDLRRLCAPEGDTLLDPSPALAAFASLVHRDVVRSTERGVQMALAFDAHGPALERARAALAELPGVALVHRAELNARLVDVVARDLPRIGLIAMLLVALLLVFSFRDLVHPLRALAPCLLAVVTTLGVFAATGTAINLMNLVVFPLLAGVGIDYGVLLADAERDPSPHALHERAFSLSVAGITTLADFGTLALTRYYAIATIGRAVLVAVLSSALYALFLPPAMAALRRRRVIATTRGRLAS